LEVAFNDGRNIPIHKTEILKQSQLVINDFLRKLNPHIFYYVFISTQAG
jgi:hypothetical protein